MCIRDSLGLEPGGEGVHQEHDLGRAGRRGEAPFDLETEGMGAPPRKGAPSAEAARPLGHAGQPGPAVAQVEEEAEPVAPGRESGEPGDEAILEAKTLPLLPLVEPLDLHLGHVHAGGALPVSYTHLTLPTSDL